MLNLTIIPTFFGYIKKKYLRFREYPKIIDGSNNKNIHLITCIGVDFDRDYLPHFIQYYKRFEISSYDFILQTNIHNTEALEESRAHIISFLPEAHITLWEGEFYPKAKAEKINTIITKNKPDWHLVVDIDEFVEFIDNSILKTLQSSKSSIFFGQLIDRVTEKGGPKKLEAGADIFIQFPRSVEYTKEIGGMICKPVLFRDQFLDKQLHKTNEYSYRQIYFWRLPVLKIYHFKWISSTKEKLIRRQSEYKKRGYGWYIESERALKHYF